MIISNHNKDANKGNLSGQLALDHFFGFCKTFKNTEGLGFHITFKTADSKDFIYTTLASDKTVTIDNLNLFVPLFHPDAETQRTFNASVKRALPNTLLNGILTEELLMQD